MAERFPTELRGRYCDFVEKHSQLPGWCTNEFQESIAQTAEGLWHTLMKSHVKRLTIDYTRERHPALAALIADIRIEENHEAEEVLAELLVAAIKKGNSEFLEEATKLAKAPLDHTAPRVRVLQRAIDLFEEGGTWPTKAAVRRSFMDENGDPLYGLPGSEDSKGWRRHWEACHLSWLEEER